MKKNNLIVKILIYIGLIIYVIVSVLPFFWSILTSIKVPIDAFSRVPKIIGFTPTSKNYADLWLQVPLEKFLPYGIGIIIILVILILVGVFANKIPVKNSYIYFGIAATILAMIFLLPTVVKMAEFYDYFLNSIIVTVGVVTVSISIGCLAGYGLARYNGLFGVVILVLALGFRALPGTAFVLPYFYIGKFSGLFDTYFLLIISLVAINQPFTIWMLRSFFMDIPREIEEAAMIDGANRLQAFWHVIIPIMWPGIITTALFSLMLAYSDFFFANTLTLTKWTLPVGIMQFTGGEDPGYVTLASAASVSISIPIVFVIIFFQKYLIKGLGAGAVKG
ncbi:MAG: carbohydrate ABC transporter permease [Chloroflexi bacterium]|nr:carbohydrate ABC transporter permease [Chloroflexota bacterium]